MAAYPALYFCLDPRQLPGSELLPRPPDSYPGSQLVTQHPVHLPAGARLGFTAAYPAL